MANIITVKTGSDTPDAAGDGLKAELLYDASGDKLYTSTADNAIPTEIGNKTYHAIADKFTFTMGGAGACSVSNNGTILTASGTTWTKEVIVGTQIQISDGSTTSEHALSTVTDAFCIFTNPWQGSTGTALTVKARVHHIKENGTGTELFRVSGVQTSVRRLCVNNETFNDIIDTTNAVIGANAGTKYYPLLLQGDRDDYGTAVSLVQAGNGDIMSMYKAGDDTWSFGVDQTASETFTIGRAPSANAIWFNNPIGSQYNVDKYLTIDSDGDVLLSSAHGVSSDYSVATKAYVDYTQYIRHYLHCGWNQPNTTKSYMPLNGYSYERTTTSGYNESIAFCAPHNGLVEKVIVRSEEACGNRSKVGFHKSDEGTEVPSTSATETIEVDMTADDTGYTFAFTGTSSFDKGDVLAFSFQGASNANDTIATIVLKFDTTT